MWMAEMMAAAMGRLRAVPMAALRAAKLAGLRVVRSADSSGFQKAVLKADGMAASMAVQLVCWKAESLVDS